MKKHFFIFSMLALGFLTSTADVVCLNFHQGDYNGTAPGHPKSPVAVPYVELNGFVLEFETNHSNYTLQLIDEDDTIVHSVYVPTSVTTLTLPSSLSGDYELRLYPDGSNFYFYGYVMF